MDFPILIILMNPLSFFRCSRSDFSFSFCILLHIHRQWNHTVYHGGDTDIPGLRRYRPDAVPVETRLLPASSRLITVFDSLPGYSRWVPVVLNILKQPGTWAGLTRFNTVHPGSPRLSTVPPRLWHGSSRFIPDHQTGVNRHLKPGQWERGFNFVKIIFAKIWKCTVLNGDVTSRRIIMSRDCTVNAFVVLVHSCIV